MNVHSCHAACLNPKCIERRDAEELFDAWMHVDPDQIVTESMKLIKDYGARCAARERELNLRVIAQYQNYMCDGDEWDAERVVAEISDRIRNTK